MLELNHKFHTGRMNKDLDERLVPNGEYRDALNIEVNTSEGSPYAQQCLFKHRTSSNFSSRLFTSWVAINIVLPSKKSNMAPVTVPIKVKSISKTTVLPAIQKQKTSQPTRPGTTVPVFNINSDSAARNVTVISLGIEETL